jgi:hypothetical protein
VKQFLKRLKVYSPNLAPLASPKKQI